MHDSMWKNHSEVLEGRLKIMTDRAKVLGKLLNEITTCEGPYEPLDKKQTPLLCWITDGYIFPDEEGADIIEKALGWQNRVREYLNTFIWQERAKEYLNPPKNKSKTKHKFQKVSCSHCGKVFGPRDSGYSHCEDHKREIELGINYRIKE